MPSLNDLLGKAKLPTPSGIRKDIAGQARAAIRSTTNEIRNIPAGIISSGLNSAKGAVSGAVNGGLGAIRGAVAKAITGDFSGALTQLEQGPANFMSALGLGTGVAGSGPGGAINPLQGALSRADPLMSFQWYCQLPAITPVGGAEFPALPWNYVEEATVPMRGFDVRAVFAQGRNRHYAGVYNVDQLNLHFYADVENKALAYLQAWQQAILAPFSASDYTKGGGYGRPSGYQRPIRIYIVAPDYSTVFYVDYVECWPVNLDALQLDSGSSNRLTFNVNFSVGDAFPTMLGVNKNAAGNELIAALKSTATNAALNILF